ncbi:hypothetical protein RUND412_007824 [Rhizina undulata]
MTRSNFVIRHPSAKELAEIRKQNSVAWAGGLAISQYLEREEHIGSTSLTADGGITTWVLVNPTQHPQEILASSESIRKVAVIASKAEEGEEAKVEEVITHVIGSVFTPESQRGNGYAAVMLMLLQEKLRTWQVPEGSEAGFSALYSDIGKKFYSRLGWSSHPANHINIPVPSSIDETSPTSEVSPIYAKCLPRLCARDIAVLKKSLSTPSSKRRIAFMPSYPVLQWHHAREEFLADYFRADMDTKPIVKGAMTSDGKRWISWSRTYHEDPRLYILRIASVAEDNETEEEDLAKLLQAAQKEAKLWGLKKVVIWNPKDVVVRAANRIAAEEVVLVERDVESIPSVMMYRDADQGSGIEELDWVANERFTWC